jgi:hypothetical protein
MSHVDKEKASKWASGFLSVDMLITITIRINVFIAGHETLSPLIAPRWERVTRWILGLITCGLRIL